MPIFTYRAITENGIEVKNRIEETSKQNLIRKLKRNNLMPITVTQVKRSKASTLRGNANYKNKMLKEIDANNILKRKSDDRRTRKEKVNEVLYKNQKITSRDLVIFTQNFYLLKKANFNNIHALATILESTENFTLKERIEEMLSTVEAGENIYKTMEIYETDFPYIYTNMIKVGELSGSLTKSLEQAVRYLDDSTAITTKIKKIVIPNVLMFVGIMLMLVIGTIFVIPLVEGVYADFGTEAKLPAATLWFMKLLRMGANILVCSSVNSGRNSSCCCRLY